MTPQEQIKIYQEEANELFGKFNNIDDAIIAADELVRECAMYNSDRKSYWQSVRFDLKKMKDNIENKIEEYDFISCTGCDKECTDIESMESDDDANWFCAECWAELSPGMRKEYEELKAKGEID